MIPLALGRFPFSLFLTNHYLLSLILGAGLVLLVMLSVNFGGLVIMLTLRSLITAGVNFLGITFRRKRINLRGVEIRCPFGNITLHGGLSRKRDFQIF